MAGIKKIVRPMNKAKNDFVKWLKDNKAEDIKGLKNEDDCCSWDYYIHITAFINETLYMVCFMVWESQEKIDYSDGENRYYDMSIEDFKQLF